MSSIDELIKELAPHGVKKSKLGDIGMFIRGVGLQKSALTDVGAPAIHYGQIHTHYGTWADSTKSFTDPSYATKLRRAQPGDLVIATTSEDDAAVAKATAWLGDGDVAVSSDAYIFRHTLDPRYVAYFFQSTRFQDQKRPLITGTKVRRVSGESLAKIKIPVPPRDVQRKIVRVLDQFTQLETELEANLEAELKARRHQYEHYRRELLAFESGIEWATLGDVANYTNGRAHERLANPDGNIPMVTARFISRNGEANRFVRLEDVQTPANAGDTALVLSDLPNGRALARTFFINRDNSYAINQRVARLRVKDVNQVAPRFLYYVLNRNPGLLKYDNGSDQTHLSKGQVTGLRFPIPPVSEQLRIVDVLDAFNALMNDLDIGLSAELAARRKHYEYYRDKLLTFDEAAV